MSGSYGEFVDSELRGMLEEIQRKLESQGTQISRQGQDLERLMRVTFGDSDTPMGMKQKVDTVYATVYLWQNQWQGAKKVLGGFLFLLTSGAIAALWTLLRGYFGTP